MATVYSLICYKGTTGATVTFTDAGDLCNLTDHYMVTGLKIRFDTTGTLPTGLSTATPYYARYSTANAVTLHETKADALANTGQVTFSGTGSGTHKVYSGYYVGMSSDELDRYGPNGSRRIYGGMQAWNNARTGVELEYDTETGEIADQFQDYINDSVYFQMACASQIFHSKINGVHTEAWHGGIPGRGYIARTVCYERNTIIYNKLYRVIDGIEFYNIGNSTYAIVFLDYTSHRCQFSNNILGISGTYNSSGIQLRGTFQDIFNNYIYKMGTGSSSFGIRIDQYECKHINVYNNTVTGCYNGFFGYNVESYGYYFNNVSIGNTVNWGTEPATINKGAYNAGLSTDSPWSTGTDTSIDITTSDFTDTAASPPDMTPDSASAVHVGTGLAVYGGNGYDLFGKIRPAMIDITHEFNYDNEASGPFVTWQILSWGSGGTSGTGRLVELTDNGATGQMRIHLLTGVAPTDNEEITNGSATCDVNGTVTELDPVEWVPSKSWSAGAIEFDYGGPQALVDIVLQNVKDDSEWWVKNEDTNTVIDSGTQSGTADITIADVAYTEDQLLTIRVRKFGTSGSDYKPFETNATLTSNGATVWVSQDENLLT